MVISTSGKIDLHEQGGQRLRSTKGMINFASFCGKNNEPGQFLTMILRYDPAMNFTAIDFETATYTRNNACAIGLVTVENSQITDTYYSRIRPPENEHHSLANNSSARHPP